MAGRTFSGRDGAIRLYDGSTPAKYIELPFVQMNFQGPVARQRPLDPIVPTVGGYTHAPTSPDYDAAFFDPLPISFSFWVQTDVYYAARQALSNLDMSAPWKVGQSFWVSTKGRGSVVMPDRTYRATQPFFDDLKQAVNIQVKWAHPAARGSVVAMSYDEVYFPPQSMTINESPDFVEIRVGQAMVYGNIQPIGDFSSGTSSV